MSTSSTLTEPLVDLATLLDDLHNTGAESLDRGNVVGEDTHVTGRGGDVDLGDTRGRVDGLHSLVKMSTEHTQDTQGQHRGIEGARGGQNLGGDNGRESRDVAAPSSEIAIQRWGVRRRDHPPESLGSSSSGHAHSSSSMPP